MKSREIIAFGPFALDPVRRRVTRMDTGEGLALTGRPFTALHYLAARPGVLVTRAELFHAVWSGISVEDNSLARCIAMVRKALGEAPSDRRYIVTEPGRGYRFVAPIVAPDRPVNANAHELYVSACALLARPGGATIGRALEKLESAVALDPAFARAQAAIANANLMLGVFGLVAPRDVFPKAQAAAETAIRLDESLADAHMQLGHIASMFALDRVAAEAHLRRALALDERSAMAHHHMALLAMTAGAFDDALVWMRRALDLQPLAANIRANIGMVLYFAGRYRDAIAQLDATLEIVDFAHARALLGRCWLRLGDAETALNHFGLRTEACIGSAADEPAALALAGRLDESRTGLAALLDARRSGYVSAYDIATVYSAQGEQGLALQWLEVALEERAQPIAAVAVDPAFDSLADDARFEALLERVDSLG